MANGEEVREVWQEVNAMKDRHAEQMREIDRAVSNTEKIAIRIENTINNHIQEKAVHHEPPCYSLKTLINRLWAVAAAVIGLVIHQVIRHVG